MNVKIVFNQPYCGINSGWPLRYMGLTRQICSFAKVTVFAPGDTSLLREALPGANVCASTPLPPASVQRSRSAWYHLLKLIRPGYSIGHLDTFSPSLKNLIRQYSTKAEFDLSVYFGHCTYPYHRDVEESDVIFCDFCDSLERYLENTPVVSLKDRLVKVYDRCLIRRFKRLNYPNNRNVVLISEKDAEYVRRSLKNNRIYVIPNGVEMTMPANVDTFVSTKYHSNIVLFVGVLSYQPNIASLQFTLQNIWPTVVSKYPDLRFQIVGRGDAAPIRNMAQGMKNVDIVGEVPDVMPYFKNARFLLAPFFSGGGLKNKFLEALSCGTPIITNIEGATGIDVEHGRHALICKDVTTLLAAVDTIMHTSEQEYETIIHECRALAKRYSWSTVGDQLKTIFEKSLRI